MINIYALKDKNYEYLKNKGTYTEIDGGDDSKFLLKSKMIRLLSIIDEIDFEKKLLSNELFVRHYIENYSSGIDETMNSWGEAFDSADKIRKLSTLIKEAYKEFEKQRLLKLLPEKKDEAPIKQRKKI